MMGLVKMFIEHEGLVREWTPGPRKKVMKVMLGNPNRWLFSRRWYELIDSCPLRMQQVQHSASQPK